MNLAQNDYLDDFYVKFKTWSQGKQLGHQPKLKEYPVN